MGVLWLTTTVGACWLGALIVFRLQRRALVRRLQDVVHRAEQAAQANARALVAASLALRSLTSELTAQAPARLPRSLLDLRSTYVPKQKAARSGDLTFTHKAGTAQGFVTGPKVDLAALTGRWSYVHHQPTFASKEAARIDYMKLSSPRPDAPAAPFAYVFNQGHAD